MQNQPLVTNEFGSKIVYENDSCILRSFCTEESRNQFGRKLFNLHQEVTITGNVFELHHFSSAKIEHTFAEMKAWTAKTEGESDSEDNSLKERDTMVLYGG